MAADIVVKNDPELQSQVNQSISKYDKINDNQDILTDSEKEERSGTLDSIKDNIKKRNQYEKNSPEWVALDQFIQEDRAELKEISKEQNRKYKNVSKEQRDALAANQQQVNQNKQAIESLPVSYTHLTLPTIYSV